MPLKDFGSLWPAVLNIWIATSVSSQGFRGVLTIIATGRFLNHNSIVNRREVAIIIGTLAKRHQGMKTHDIMRIKSVFTAFANILTRRPEVTLHKALSIQQCISSIYKTAYLELNPLSLSRWYNKPVGVLFGLSRLDNCDFQPGLVQ